MAYGVYHQQVSYCGSFPSGRSAYRFIFAVQTRLLEIDTADIISSDDNDSKLGLIMSLEIPLICIYYLMVAC